MTLLLLLIAVLQEHVPDLAVEDHETKHPA
jgi:hypothetical protein